MRRLITLVGVVLALSTTTPAMAAAEPAVVRGSLVTGDDGSPAEGAKITLIGARLDGSGRFFTDTVESDQSGRFEFARVPVREASQFALEATFDGGLFVFDTFRLRPGATESFDLEVWPTTSNASVIEIERDHLFLAQDEQGAGVLESVTVVNRSQRAYIGRGGALGGGASTHTLGFALPDAAVGERVDLIDSTLNRLYADAADFGFAATVAIPPGETTVTFAYPAPGSGGRYDLSRRALYPTKEIAVFVTEPLELNGDVLAYDGVEEVAEDSYRKWSSRDPFDAGDLVPILAVAEGSSMANLWMGLGAGLGLLVLVTIVAAARRRPAPSKPPRPAAPPPPIRDELISAIAELDLQHESGALSEDEWNARRAALKDQLVAARQRKPTS